MRLDILRFLRASYYSQKSEWNCIEWRRIKEELAGLAQDIVRTGLGASISKVYLPEGYDLNNIFGALYPHADLMDSAKYATITTIIRLFI